VKKAADAAGRKVCFIGMSLHTYLEAAWRDGRAPFDPREIIHAAEIEDHDPSKLLIVTTGSQVTARRIRKQLTFVSTYTGSGWLPDKGLRRR
jgi:mRNA degradation ribonuclease J1/J2